MKVLDCQPLDQIFSHTDDDNGTTRHFNSSAIIRAIGQRKIKPNYFSAPLEQGLIDHLVNNHGVEEDHLTTLTDKQLESPVLVAHFKDGQDLIIDGNHRMVARWRKGFKEVDLLVVEEDDWTPYLLEDVDQTYTREEVAEYLSKLSL